ncbi:hypothetical protein HYDPIDRAFT_119891 [Hydnomerulius pinastri MD-312]|uniref:DUF6534 domain-containing protein n=1 Tax=Hydnomerulius pinastri MD-312 TaxID=994086 RepID=A0A0C9VXW6_9AGAM|nr:hypothetical protein HYDPIDRAFT_119891 [Hydnomerulius pinastri MD-312]
MTTDAAFQLLWGPGACGFIISLALFGATLGQSIFYFRCFPDDLKSLRVVVRSHRTMDIGHTYCMAGLYWKFLISCHGVTSFECPVKLPWYAAVLLSYLISSTVQGFYVHRVWIISGRNILLTGLIAAIAIVEFVCTNVAFATWSAPALYSTPWSPRSAGASVICDVLITGSVFFYLRASRRGVRRSQNYFRQLTVVFVNMGVLTCMIATSWCLLYLIQGGNYYTAFPTTFICKSYANSLLAVLNARKSIRERERELRENGHDLATINYASHLLPSLGL